MADGERIDDDVALRTLVAFHGVDADGLQHGNVQFLDFPANHGYLVAIGHDDSDGLGGVEGGIFRGKRRGARGKRISVDVHQFVCHDAGFFEVCLVGKRVLAFVQCPLVHRLTRATIGG